METFIPFGSGRLVAEEGEKALLFALLRHHKEADLRAVRSIRKIGSIPPSATVSTDGCYEPTSTNAAHSTSVRFAKNVPVSYSEKYSPERFSLGKQMSISKFVLQ
ncbi:hypothetical protein [Leisingera aquaemixtae]|uniref:Uncharacterized protein n=1 Tax=Leisingera aquaemixtae TaxID=1396826 RepID=A0A0P1H7K5_9RHOB|nr:hypothetical protein [Leisingera aquaemixtae]CUH99168.1 hypothetical protein PHA8399_01284 [Leisingera aquaemixtae]